MNKTDLIEKSGDLSFANHLKMLTSEQVALLLNVGIDQVTMLRETGALKPIKTGKNYMFSQSDIERFQEEFLGLDCSNRVKVIESLEALKMVRYNV